MELKTKFQYTYFIHPYVIDEAKYEKYILKLLKNPKCSYKIFEKEKDYDIYNFFLPHVRKFMFPTFELRDERLKRFNEMKPENTYYPMISMKELNNSVKLNLTEIF